MYLFARPQKVTIELNPKEADQLLNEIEMNAGIPSNPENASLLQKIGIQLLENYNRYGNRKNLKG